MELFRETRCPRNEALCRVFNAGALARLGETELASDILGQGRTVLREHGDAQWLIAAELQQAQIDLSRSRRCLRVGEVETAEHLRGVARAGMSSAPSDTTGAVAGGACAWPEPGRCRVIRLVRRLLARELEREEADTVLRIWPDGGAFQLSNGPITPLPDGQIIRAVLRGLADHRLAAPGRIAA